MHILQNVSLKLHSTMRLGGTARYVCEITNEEELLEAIEFARKASLPVRAIGMGSNIIWRDEGYQGVLLVNKIGGSEVLGDGVVRFGAGVEWDDAVLFSVKQGLSGLEFLSLIPGTVGATPVQNVGAYGSEIKDTFESLHAYDTHEKKFVDFSAEDCRFGYRTSRFKEEDSGRFIITSVTFRLSNLPPQPPFYEALQKYLDENNIQDLRPETIRAAVIEIRTNKLPDPHKVANNGSFFANPVIEKPSYDKLLESYPDLKGWELPDGRIKIAAGWLVEKAGFKDHHDPETGMATWGGQSLVLINEHATTALQLEEFKNKIVSKVNDLFGIVLEQEPELLP